MDCAFELDSDLLKRIAQFTSIRIMSIYLLCIDVCDRSCGKKLIK